MKINILIVAILLITFTDCAFVERITTQNCDRELVDLNTFKIDQVAKSAAYGYSSQQPIKVGGADDNKGVLNERRFLNALRGPKGEKVTYELKGSCCYYKLPETSTSTIGLLDQYEVSVSGQKYILFLSSFETETELLAPRGFSFVSN